MFHFQIFVRWSLSPGGSITSPSEKNSLQPYTYIHTQNYTLSFLGKSLIVSLLVPFSDILVIYLPLSFFYIYHSKESPFLYFSCQITCIMHAYKGGRHPTVLHIYDAHESHQ